MCVQAKRAGSWGTYPVKMLRYYLSSGGYESQETAGGKERKNAAETEREDGWAKGGG